MNVALDMQLAVGTATGIGEYVRGLVRALRAEPVELVALNEPQLNPWRFDRRVLWDQAVLPYRAWRLRADLLHCTSGTMPAARALPVVVTVHDVAWLRVQQHARSYARWYFGRFSLQQYRRARAILVDSAFSRDELLELVALPPECVHVVHPGVADDYRTMQPLPVTEPPFVLVPGTVEPRKNLEVLVRALAALPGVRIVSVGPATPYRQTCEALADELGVRDRVEFRGYVERKTLIDLYARAAVVAVPSKYEGFGYAAAQALCAGIPLVASDASALPEVCDGDAILVAPENVDAWADALRAVVFDRSARSRASDLRARHIERFSWATAARATLAVYESALQR